MKRETKYRKKVKKILNRTPTLTHYSDQEDVQQGGQGRGRQVVQGAVAAGPLSLWLSDLNVKSSQVVIGSDLTSIQGGGVLLLRGDGPGLRRQTVLRRVHGRGDTA